MFRLQFRLQEAACNPRRPSAYVPWVSPLRGKGLAKGYSSAERNPCLLCGRVAEILRDRANAEHAAELRRVERVTGIKQAGAELVAFGRIARGEERDEA